MSARVTVVCGPALSGKTRLLRDEYRRALESSGVGSCLWIAPTQRGVITVRERLLDDGLSGCFAPGVTTFERFAAEILRSSSRPVVPLNPLMKRRLVGRLIREAAESGRLSYFAPIAETRGLVELVSEWISEWKRAEIWPNAFRRACGERMTRKDRELADLYEQYQDRLLAHQLYDAEGRFWSAREILRDDPPSQVKQLQLVVVDGFTDFTRTQHEILELLAAMTAQIYVSLPLESEPCREDLFNKTRLTLGQLRDRLGNVTIRPTDPPASPTWPALANLERRLFRNPREKIPAATTDGIEILEASGELGEIESIGRRIKQLLLEGDGDAPAARVRPNDIAVVFRSLREVAPLVREVFDELGLPYALEAGAPLTAAPVIKVLLELVRLAANDWPFDTLLSVINNNDLDPDSTGQEPTGAVRVAERLVREFQFPSGRKALLAALERRAERGEANEPEDPISHGDEEIALRRERKRREATCALVLLRRLDTALEGLPQKETATGWLESLGLVARELGLGPGPKSDGDSWPMDLNRHGWGRLEQAFGAEEDLLKRLGETPSQLNLRGFQRELSEMVHWLSFPPASDETGHVRVLAAASARALDFRYLFLAGLSEKAFPQLARREGLHSETQYRRLNEAGLPLVLRDERSKDEMLLFYELVTRARRRLFLSYPAQDEKLERLLPSPYLNELERAFGTEQIERRTERDINPLRQVSKPYTRSDLRLLAVRQAVEGDALALATLVAHDSSAALGANLIGGLRTVKERAQRESFGPFEGLLLGTAASGRIASAFGREHAFSPSQIEDYANCPFRFYAERVLRVEPVAGVELATDHARRGWVLHETLSAFHQRINTLAGKFASPADLDADTQRSQFAEVLTAITERLGSENPIEITLRDIDSRVILTWADRYLGQHEKYDAKWKQFDDPPRPAFFEVSFGMPDPEESELSREEPFCLGQGTEAIRIVGRIDRIDVGRIGAQRVFNLLDYKSDRTPASSTRTPETPDPSILQLDLYAIAAEELLFGGEVSAWQTGHWSVRRGGFRPFLKISESHGGEVSHAGYWPRRKEQVIANIEQLVRGIRAGQFPVSSRDPDCTRTCPFSTVCRIGQVRALEKTWSAPK